MIVRLTSDNISQLDVSNFVIEYKTIINSKKIIKNFKIVEGDDIKKWYLGSNYTDGGGNLKDSCMRHKFCQGFFELYTKNSDKVKLLILLDNNHEKILGRALLWNLDKPSGRVFMDRVYFSDEYIYNIFINYAIKNEWYYRTEEMLNILKVMDKYKPTYVTMVINVKKIKYEFFPFLDIMAFYYPKTSTLTNNPKYLKTLGCTEYYDLCGHLGFHEVGKDFDFKD
jgi:hypothetical protein